VECRTCGASVDSKCRALDGTGREITIVHVTRMEDAGKLVAE
jgi:hypothetical protein